MKKSQRTITVEDIEKAQEASETVADAYPVKAHVHQVIKTHVWRQNGAHVECNSCEHPHSTHIGTDKILVGIDPNGQPVFEKVKIQSSPSQQEAE